MRTEDLRKLGWMTILFVAMAFLESAVVVYLRALSYPDGFELTLVPMDPGLVRTEVWREVATMVMLLAPGALVARSALERFAWFCFGFGVWDIFYYIWLKVLLDWPASLATPDLLFLIPVPWIGPVWAPCLISIGLIILAFLLLRHVAQRPDVPLGVGVWSSLVGGACLMIISFLIVPLSQAFGLHEMMHGAGSSSAHGPLLTAYPWGWLLAGMILATSGLLRVYRSGRMTR